MVQGRFAIEDFPELISTLPFGLMKPPYFGIVGHFPFKQVEPVFGRGLETHQKWLAEDF